MKSTFTQLSVLLTLMLVAAISNAQCDPNFDFGGAPYDYYPNADESESFDDGVINSFYSDVFHFVVPAEAGDIDPLLGILGLTVDSLTFVGVTTLQGGVEINLNDMGIALTCNNQGTLVLDCSFLPDMQYCIALEGTTIESGSFELIFNFDIHAAIIGIPSTFPFSLPAIDLQILGYGCADEAACNYEEFVIADNNFCIYGGCAIPNACNYDSTAACDDGSCILPEDFYDCEGECLSDTDGDGVCDELEIPGCYDSLACNFNPNATDDSGDCFYETEFYDCNGDCFNDADGDGVCDEFEIDGCTNEIACNFESLATDNDGSCVFLETFAIVGEEAPVQFEDQIYSYPFTAGSSYVWEISSAGSIVNEDDGSITVQWTEGGSFEVCVIETDSEGCSSSQICLDIEVEQISGVEDHLNDTSVHLYPIPSAEILHVSGLPEGVFNFEIYAIEGQKVAQGSFESSLKNDLEIQSLAKGAYVLQLESGSFSHSFRFMK
jgi:hypothetical protein